MKKIIVVILIIVLIGIGLVIAGNTPQTGSNRTDLSDRAKEFLKTQQSKGNIEFSGINSANDKSKVQKPSELIDVGECFSIDIPFPIEEKKELGSCFDQIVIASPRGMINVYTREVSFASLEDDPGVKMRRNEKVTYKEEKVEANGKTFVTFKRTDGGYERTALYLEGGKLFSLNLLTNFPNESTDGKFLDMLKSVNFD